ncbi:transcription initiation factor IIA subunit 1-like [Telopea speciosissima]|uniref:transcription initiation factor IIA subunit 1-like n=1 Tax=Telopea speciosissima TaxID=54955 RepID=UPI001CC64ED6|nr:transcription initiation factor IIA subunit 1-like [Telopea speciosissima]
MATSVSAVYLHVVDVVFSKLREEFINEAVEDSVLTDLKGLWELKMMQCGVIQGPIERNSASRGPSVPTPVHDLNVPYEGPDEYKTPTAEMLFPSTPLQTPIQTPLPVESGGDQYIKLPLICGMHVLNSIWIVCGFHLLNQIFTAYEEAREEDGGGISQPQPPMKVVPVLDFFMMTSGKRKREEYLPHFLPNGYIPQQDGSGDVSLDYSSQEMVTVPKNSANEPHSETPYNRLNIQERRNADAIIASIIEMKQASASIPQCDGYDDVYDHGVCTEDYNTPSFYVGTPKPTKTEALEDDEPPLNEDDDDDDDELDDLGQGDEESSINHLVLAQFEKVSRTKSRWKCILKDGIMRLNNKDILFSKANGEFDF